MNQIWVDPLTKRVALRAPLACGLVVLAFVTGLFINVRDIAPCKTSLADETIHFFSRAMLKSIAQQEQSELKVQRIAKLTECYALVAAGQKKLSLCDA
jgi:hypothetical protein